MAALFCVKSNAVSKASSNFSSDDFGNVLELSSVAFRLAPPHAGLLVNVSNVFSLSD